MSIQRIPRSGPAVKGKRVRWKARVKLGSVQVATRTFDTESEARRWHDDQKVLLGGSYDPRRGRITLAEFIPLYAGWREPRVQPGTFAVDRYMMKQLPVWLLKLELRAITSRHIEKWQNDLLRGGLNVASITRYRQALSPLFSRAVKEGRIGANPVTGAETLGSLVLNRDRISPYGTMDELLADVGKIAERNFVIASIYLVLAVTGLRWSEARALVVDDFDQHGIVPRLIVGKAQPEGQEVKVPKSGRTRVVPIEPAIVPILVRFATGKCPGDLLLTTRTGSQLHRSPFVRSAGLVAEVDEQRHVARLPGARRIHDLRHTAAVRWLTAGVPLHTVKEWLGHSSISTTERYLQHVGGAADKAAISLLAVTWGD